MDEPTSRSLHHILIELINNSVDEFSASPFDRIAVDFFPDGSCRVQDDGRGIPLESHGSSVGLILTIPGLGPKKAAKFACEGGLHGIGMKVTNALSQRFRVEIARDGQLWRMEFERGAVTTPLTALKPTQETGTAITFWPDPEIFTARPSFELQAILERLTEIAVLNPGLRFLVQDHRCTALFQREICFPQGLTQRVLELNRTRVPVHPTVFYYQDRADDHEVEIALQWSMANAELLVCFVNNCRTRRGGTPETGFHRALSGTFGRFSRATGLGANQNVGNERIRAGLTAIISVRVREPQWLGSTKSHLGNPEIQSYVETTMNKHLAEFFYRHPEESDAICGRMTLDPGS